MQQILESQVENGDHDKTLESSNFYIIGFHCVLLKKQKGNNSSVPASFSFHWDSV